MQDGIFRAQGHSYNVGRAIFVFTGGTNEDFDEFREKIIDADKFKNAKLPDFISRLKGYLNIQGIDSEEPSVSDELMFRRAIMLRSLLEDNAESLNAPGNANKTLNVDEVVINAFLKIQRYKHGSRSMEAIIRMSQFEKGRFMASSLPSKTELDMHVDAENFLLWINQTSVSQDVD
jgi:hypothetical protein